MDILQIIQIVSAILLIILIILQRSEAGVGGAFGGTSDADGATKKRRGPERVVFLLTILTAVTFTVSIIYKIIL